MKSIQTFALAAITLITLLACNSTGAQNKPQERKDINTKAVEELSSESFNAKVYDTNLRDMIYLGKRPAVVDFTATWCGPCRSIAPILEEIAKEYQGVVDVYKVDVDKCGDIARVFGIKSIPAVLYIPLDGDPSMTVGARNKAKFKAEIDAILLGK